MDTFPKCVRIGYFAARMCNNTKKQFNSICVKRKCPFAFNAERKWNKMFSFSSTPNFVCVCGQYTLRKNHLRTEAMSERLTGAPQQTKCGCGFPLCPNARADSIPIPLILLFYFIGFFNFFFQKGWHKAPVSHCATNRWSSNGLVGIWRISQENWDCL